MKKLLEKLSGVISDADLAELQESIRRSVEEKAALMVAEGMKKAKEDADHDADDKVAAKEKEMKAEKENDMKNLEEHLSNELDRFLETQVLDSINESLLDEVAANKACEPIVEAIMEIFADKFVAVDTKGFGLLKEAASEIESKRRELSEKINENMDIKAKYEDLQKKIFITESVIGLNDESKKRVESFFSDKSLQETESKIGSFIEMITEKKIESAIVTGVAPVIAESTVPAGDTIVAPAKKPVATVLSEASAYL
jgi:hypothetical protein